MTSRIPLAALGIGALLVSAASAADDPPLVPDPGPGPEALVFADLPDVWSATRTLRSPLDVPNEVTVLTADDIRSSGATSLVELLEMVPSLEVMRVSRSDVNVSARGFNPLVSSRVLAMIDGRAVNIDFTGTVLWESLEVSLEEIDRIEVIRGPGSGLYGANALMGIINIITKRPYQLRKFTTRSGLGPESAFSTLTAAQSSENAGIKAFAKWQVLDDFRNELSPYELTPTNRHATAQRMKQAGTTFEYLFEGGANLSLSSGVTRLDQGIVTQLGKYSLDGMLYYGKANLDVGLWRFQGFVNAMDVDVDTAGSVFPPPLPPAVPFRSRIQATTADAEIQRTLWFRGQTLVWGLNARRIVTKSQSYFGGREQETLYGAFLQDEIPLGDRWLGLAGLRVDHHPNSGFQVSPRASLVFKLSDAQRLRLLWAHSFRTPTHLSNYAQVVIPNSNPIIPAFRYTGNEDLDAEKLDTYELGYRGVLSEHATVNATVYFNRLRDFHSFYLRNPPDPLDIGIRSAQSTNAWGAEVGGEFALSPALRCFASYSFQSAHGPLERLTPRHKATAGLRGQLHPRLSYALAGRYVSHASFETDPVDASFVGSSTVPSHLTFNASLMYQLVGGVELGLHARNLFHQVRPHFPLGDEIGSELLATLRWDF